MPTDMQLLVEQALEYIEKSLATPANVQDVCGLFQMSSWQFQRVFRAHVGDSIGNYLRGRKLTFAAELLLSHSKMKVGEVAKQIHYGSQESFARSFKDYFGFSPSEIVENSSRVKMLAKPKLSRDFLNHFSSKITKQPIISESGPFELMGLETHIHSPLGVDADFDEKVPAVWRQFIDLHWDSLLANAKVKFGVALSPSQTFLEETMTYFAGVEKQAGAIQSLNLKTLTIEKTKYAIFEHIGLASKTHHSIDYIYGVWLPQSGYRRANGFDFETFDENFSMSSEDSKSCYYLPIEEG